METVSCDLCGNSDYRLYLQSRDYVNKQEGLFSVVQCKKCGLIFTNPRPDKTEMMEFYPSSTPYYVYNNASADSGKNVPDISRQLLHYFRGYFPEKDTKSIYRLLLYPAYLLKKQKLDREAIPYYRKYGKLLEIGCSYGKFLSEMKELGWEVSGIELSPHAVTTGKTVFNLDLMQNDIDKVDLTPNSYDVIIMKMFLEHVYSPRTVLKKAAQWLKPGGQLIMVVPDISGFEARLFGNFFYSLHLPNHLYHFSPETVRDYLQKNGFKISRIAHHSTDRDFIKSIENALHENPSLSPLRFLQRGPFRLFIRLSLLIMAYFWRTGRMTVYAIREGKDR